MNEVLDVAGGEITDLAFAPDGTLWMTTIEADGGKLCRVSNDQWGVTVEPVVTQIDGKALSCPGGGGRGGDGKVYFNHAGGCLREVWAGKCPPHRAAGPYGHGLGLCL